MAEIHVDEQPRRPMFTPATLAAYLSLSPRTVRDMLKGPNPTIPSYKVGGARRIHPDDVDRFLERHREPPR